MAEYKQKKKQQNKNKKHIVWNSSTSNLRWNFHAQHSVERSLVSKLLQIDIKHLLICKIKQNYKMLSNLG